ncbi:DUF2156 domain-containing protein [Parabacteroides sp. Marseille-P3160]|uniref:DUF2156 domain-containing protein n=1 Tax=Parabacteroides sp. Marseille-P3160 TaxID=1917887 RepID=UPI0009BC63B4|nr:phosphatidylglycerol lysyltransferase domain-containing protein [Parabacteroides sp. Marseille-P3160]
MLSFKPIEVKDRDIITSFTIPSEYKNCDFSFANMCSWRFFYDSEYAIVDGFLVIRFWIEDKGRIAYMFPVGNGNLSKVIDLMEADSYANGHPLCILGVTPDSKQTLEKYLPGDFIYIPERDYFDYIYLREDLAFLKGKKFQSKRNHINKFKNRYPYEYIPLTEEIIPQCLELESKWYHANRTKEDVEDLQHENRSLVFALQHFKELGILGGAIAIEGQIAAFTFGSPINHNTFGVHVEKADINYDGVFSLINQEFASRIPEQYIYVNREEDLGLPGLRQAKLSYNPAILLEKSAVVKRRDNELKETADEKATDHQPMAKCVQ